MSGPHPACHEVVDRPNVDVQWSSTLQADLDEREPCSWCFHDAASVGDLDCDLEELVVTTDGGRIHLDKEVGEPDFKTGQNPRRSLRRILAQGDVNPDEIAADPLGGEQA